MELQGLRKVNADLVGSRRAVAELEDVAGPQRDAQVGADVLGEALMGVAAEKC